MPNALTVKLLGMTRVITPDSAPERRGGIASSHLDTNISLLERKLDEELRYGQTKDSLMVEAERELAVEAPPFELALVLERYTDPKLVGDKSFEGGNTKGTLWLFSEAAGAVICVAEVGSQSADEVTTRALKETSKEEMRALSSAHLTGELIVCTIDEGLGRLRAVDRPPG